ncbi:tRNA nucleotidyltransferase [Moraxella nasibovis]|uniref:tRNA nucleotidyltransferase n=1 Tax=Moraxella nasibovis TaxID=2904120 RepID=UPI00240EF865|nr:tRNA nucleotidyltransferase [Moraxella nasibovis]WFF39135.1 tRNA nucleotidyltransferase [Moraxella nasibovis]
MQVYLVGGAVRDALLGIAVQDKDFVVVGADFDTMKSLGFVQVGADFPVFLHPDTHFEYALARIERKNGTGYQGFATQTKGVTLADDLIRRDLTINALAIEVGGLFDDTPKTGQVVDFYGGVDDLNNKILRHISPAFCEDPLRILRTVRFLARYFERGFTIADETIVLMQTMAKAGELSHLSRERFWAESVKAMESGTGHYYWQFLKELNILPYFLAELDECFDDHQILQTVLKRLALAKNSPVAVQFAMLCSGYLDGLDNENLSKTLINQTAKQLNTPKYPVQIANLLTEFWGIFAQKPNTNNILRLIEKTKAHQGNTQTLKDTLTAIGMVQADLDIVKIDELLSHAIAMYKSVSIDDIDKNLTGKEIGLALNRLREQKITQLLSEYVYE